MAIQKGDFISLNYTGGVQNGKYFRHNTMKNLQRKKRSLIPAAFTRVVVIVGAGHTIEGLDEDLEGKDAGYTGTVSIPLRLRQP